MHTDTTALYPGESSTQRVMRDVCGYEGALCATAEQLREVGAGKAVEGIYWGRYVYVNFDIAKQVLPRLNLPSIPTRIGIATVEGARCEKAPLVCAGVLRHEIAHKRGSSQTESDCYAIRMGTSRERAAYAALVESFNEPGRYEALQTCEESL